MNPLTLEWVDKAEGDIHTAKREYRTALSLISACMLPSVFQRQACPF